MKAVGYLQAGDAEQLQDVELPVPTPKNREVLVAVKAVSVNPVDCKIRTRVSPEHIGRFRSQCVKTLESYSMMWMCKATFSSRPAPSIVRYSFTALGLIFQVAALV